MPKWFWKVLKNAHKKLLESRGKPLSVICVHPDCCFVCDLLEFHEMRDYRNKLLSAQCQCKESQFSFCCASMILKQDDR